MLTLSALVLFDLFIFGSRYMVTYSFADAMWNKDAVNVLSRDKEPFRVIVPGADVNSGMANRMDTPNGYDTILVKRFSEYINLSQGKPASEPILWINVTRVGPLVDILNAKYILVDPKTPLQGGSFKEVFNGKDAILYQNLNAFPRAFIVHSAKFIPDKQAIFQELLSKDFDPRSYAIVEEGAPAFPNAPAQRSPQPKIISYAADKITIEADLSGPGLLVLGDTYYPGWKALVDGRETKILKANYVMRAVELPQGRHRVEFYYSPASFRIGAAVSLTALLIAGYLLIRSRKQRNDGPESSAGPHRGDIASGAGTSGE
jgi:hypothetical protein